MQTHYRTEAQWLAEFAREQSRLEYKWVTGCEMPTSPLTLHYSPPVPIQVQRPLQHSKPIPIRVKP